MPAQYSIHSEEEAEVPQFQPSSRGVPMLPSMWPDNTLEQEVVPPFSLSAPPIEARGPHPMRSANHDAGGQALNN